MDRIRAMGFDAVCIPPLFRASETDPFLAIDSDSGDDRAAEFARACDAAGLRLIVDVVLDRIDGANPLAQAFPESFQSATSPPALDPRREASRGLRLHLFAEPLTAWWTSRLARLAKHGVAGFRLLGLDALPVDAVRTLVQGVPEAAHMAWTPGMAWPRVAQLADAGLSAVFASLPWWDARAPWYVEEHEILRRVAPIIVPVEAPFGDRMAARATTPQARALLARQALQIAVESGDGIFVPMGFEFCATRRVDHHAVPDDIAGDNDLQGDILQANVAKPAPSGPIRSLTGPGETVSILARIDAGNGTAILINTDFARPRVVDSAVVVGNLVGAPVSTPLQPGEVRVVELRAIEPIVDTDSAGDPLAATAAPRIVVENLSPCVDGGAFAVKRIVGQPVTVEADIYTDGHELLQAELLWRPVDEKEWQRLPLELLGNDRWQASFTPTRIGRHLLAVEAWWDVFGTLRHSVEAKHAAGVDVASDLAEMSAYLQALADRRVPCTAARFAELATVLGHAHSDTAVKAVLSPEMRAVVSSADPRAFAERSAPVLLDAERRETGFASWYELFPRSLTDNDKRHGTFDDVIAALPRISAMGFDVLYFPPIHPIGTKNRKGPNNTLVAGPDDVGSPYAIGSAVGGHDAIHPSLGTPQDFRRLIGAARTHGLEIALDFAIQCSPDHPWLRDHPEWFKRQTDGTIKYAENPPKKYQDIHNVDFYATGAVPSLWVGLRDIVQYWVDEGVKIFRVDNPHTKPLPFWQWMIADIRGRDPAVIFLAEAFTRPKVMYRLAKVGFSQSYTYFTWRNTKRELTEYLTELSTTEVAEFFRPHFFVNTPDINPVFLQTSGRAGFLIRAALACTLSGLWGMYSGFEIAEAAPLPGREEYLDSEKYQIRVRDLAAPGNIVAEITALNRLRRAHPALQSHLGLAFYNAFNDQILLYGKSRKPGADMILVAVSLDPHSVQEAIFEVPLWEWNLPDDGALEVEDLLTGNRFVWRGKLQRLRLDPAVLPYAIWRIAPVGGVVS